MVKASTSTSPNLSDIVPFVIQVTDSNDSDPVFDSQIYRTEVPEDTPRETTILKGNQFPFCCPSCLSKRKYTRQAWNFGGWPGILSF